MIRAAKTVEDDYRVYESMFKPLDLVNARKKKPLKLIDFIAEDLFGGSKAKASYNPKKQTATIKDGHTIYNFSKMISNRTNESLPNKKNLDPNLMLIGSFNTKTNHAGMPVTTYLFGVLNKNEKLLKNNASLEQRTEPVLLDNNGNNVISKVDPTTCKPIMVGTDSRTWAPIIFDPSDQFAGEGLIGNYFASSSVATIHDPSGTNKQSYRFKRVQKGGVQQPEGLVLIGSYASRPQCSGNICSHAIMMVNLYGTLQPEESSDQSTPSNIAAQ